MVEIFLAVLSALAVCQGILGALLINRLEEQDQRIKILEDEAWLR